MIDNNREMENNIEIQRKMMNEMNALQNENSLYIYVLYRTVFSVELLSLFKCQCVYCRVVQPLEISMFSVELLSITLCKCQCVHTALVI